LTVLHRAGPLERDQRRGEGLVDDLDVPRGVLLHPLQVLRTVGGVDDEEVVRAAGVEDQVVDDGPFLG
jgi:hypothetical protein